MPAIPEQGAPRLWIERGDGAARAHRVLISGKPHRALVGDRRRIAVEVRSVVDAMPVGADGPRTPLTPFVVPLDELTQAEPLSAADWLEYDRLDAALAGTFGEARALKRFNALRLRALVFGQVSPL